MPRMTATLIHFYQRTIKSDISVFQLCFVLPILRK